MRQALHIFRKDIRYLRAEIGILLAISALLVANPSQPSEILWLLAAAYVIVRMIHAEAIPGDRQFWTTRPYEWQSLLTAKLLFLLAFVNLPLLLAQSGMLLVLGFPLGANLPGLLWSSMLLFGCVSVPIAALATITSNLVQFLFSAFILTIVEFAAPQVMTARFAGATLPGPWPESVEWMRDVLGTCILLAGAAVMLYWQYRNRRTHASRVLASGLLALSVTVWLWMSPGFAFSLEPHLSKQPDVGASLIIDAGPDSRAIPYQHPPWTKPYQLLAPIAARHLPPHVTLQADALVVLVQPGTGGKWRAVNGVISRVLQKNEDSTLNAVISVSEAEFPALAGQPFSLRGSVYLTLFGNPRSQTIPVPHQPVNVFGNLQCFLGPLDADLMCRSAFPWPAALVSAKTADGDLGYLTTLVSYSPFPATLGINPFQTYFTSAPPKSAREVTIVAAEPLAHVRRDFELHGLRLVASPTPSHVPGR